MLIFIESKKTGDIIETTLNNYKNALNCSKNYLNYEEGIKDNTKNKELINQVCKSGKFENENFIVWIDKE